MTDPIVDNVLGAVADQEVGRRLPRALTPFRQPGYRTLALSLVFSALATGMWLIALVWEVFRLDGTARQLSIVSAAAALGVVLTSLLAGVAADRFPKKRILVTVASVQATGMATVATLAWLDLTGVWLLAVIAMLMGMAMAFYYPAYSSLLPAVVPATELMAVNGFEGMVRPTISQAIGPAIAGLVIGSLAPSAAFGLAATSMLLSLLVLLRLPHFPVTRQLDPEQAKHPVRSALRDMAEGISYVRRTPWLLGTLLFSCLMMLAMMGPLEVLIPYFIKSDLGGTAQDHSLVLAAFGIGGAVGSFAMASRPMPRRYLTATVVGWGFAAVPFLLVAHATNIWMIVASALVMGVFFSAPMVLWGTLLQRRVPSDLLGRVSSLDFFVAIALMPVSMALVGPVSDALGTQATFYVAALAPVVLSVVTLAWARMPADEVAHPLT